MLSGVKNVSFRCIIWTKEISFWQSDTCCFFKQKVNSFIKIRSRGHSSNHNFKLHEIWGRGGGETDFFKRFKLKQLPIHDGTKN